MSYPAMKKFLWALNSLICICIWVSRWLAIILVPLTQYSSLLYFCISLIESRKSRIRIAIST